MISISLNFSQQAQEVQDLKMFKMPNPIDHFRYVGKKNVNQNCRNQLFLNRLPRISDDLNQTFEDMINMAV